MNPHKRKIGLAVKRPKHPPTKCIAIDVDGTLLINSKLNRKLLVLIEEKRAAGYAKPGFIVDDMGWDWIKYTTVIRVP